MAQPASSSQPPKANSDGTASPSVVLYSTSPDSSRRSSIIGRPPPADLFSSLRLDSTVSDPALSSTIQSPTFPNSVPGTSGPSTNQPSEDANDAMQRRPSMVSFNEPASHADRTRSVGSLFHQLYHHHTPHTHTSHGHHAHTGHHHAIHFPHHGRKPAPPQKRGSTSSESGVATINSTVAAVPIPTKSVPHRVSSMIIDPISSSAPGPLSDAKITAMPGPASLNKHTFERPLPETKHSSDATHASISELGKGETKFEIPFVASPGTTTPTTPVTNENVSQVSTSDFEFISRRDSRLERVSSVKKEPAPAPAPSAVVAAGTSVTTPAPAPAPAATATSCSSSDDENEAQKLHILVACTGSVATIKIPLIIAKLRKMYGQHAVVQLIVTSAAEHFLRGVKLPPDVKIWHDHDEWTSRRGVAEAVLHVQLRRWADILLIAPLSANTLAKMANGICDNLITSVFRAWNTTTPVIVAPAMNTHMYTNPMTKKHLGVLQSAFPYVHVLKPIEKVLVCGDIGMGGMREWTDVVDNVVRQLGGPPMSVEEEEEEEEREKREKRLAKKRRESADEVGEEEQKEEEDDEDDDDDDDDDEDDDDDDDEDDDDGYNTSSEPGTPLNPKSAAPAPVSKPKLMRSNTADI